MRKSCDNICRVEPREIKKVKLLLEVGLLKLGLLVIQGFRRKKPPMWKREKPKGRRGRWK